MVTRTRLPRIGDAVAARRAAEAAEDLRVDDAEAGAGQHRHGQLGNHRQVEGHPVAGLQPGEVAQQRRRIR